MMRRNRPLSRQDILDDVLVNPATGVRDFNGDPNVPWNEDDGVQPFSPGPLRGHQLANGAFSSRTPSLHSTPSPDMRFLNRRSHESASSNEGSPVVGNVQGQVAINTFLEGLKKNQDAFQEKVLEKINILVEKSNMQVVEKNIPQDCSGESTTSNIRTPRELSRTLKNLSKQDGYQFIPEERIESVRNSGVREKLNNVLKDKFQDKFTHLEYQVSVTQRYNSERVKFRESQNPDFGDQQKSRRRIRSRQHKLMKRRQLKVLESERPIWKHVKAELMSEEEGEIDGAVLCQKPSWRTDKLNEIINTIDERLKADPKFRVLMNRRKYAQRPCSRPRPTKYFPAELVQPE